MDLRRNPPQTPPAARQLALRHGRRLLRRIRAGNEAEEALGPGMERLFSFYAPGVLGGLHQIDVGQDIAVAGQSKSVTSSHQFNVVAPRFALPQGAIDSVYPPPGHADRPEVLPHVVFNDPMLPWERAVRSDAGDPQPTDVNYNRVPWLAVMLFTQDELRVSPTRLNEICAEIASPGGIQQSTSMAVPMSVSDARQLPGVAQAIPTDPTAEEASLQTDVIFVPSALFSSLFARYGPDGSRDSSQKAAQVYPYRYLAHVRHVHLDSTAMASSSDADDHAFSVVVCPRTGPLTVSQPTTVVAHLVSLESVESVSFPVAQDVVAMCSLHSWQYTCLPAGSFNVADAFSRLGNNVTALVPTLSAGDTVTLLLNLAGRLMLRVEDGFSLIRYRLPTGEVTAGWMRGPCVPTAPNIPPDSPLPSLSTTGTNLQILDQELNIMDITYSAAWQLGKTLALADLAFLAALARVRKQIYDLAMDRMRMHLLKTQAAVFRTPAAYKSRAEVISTIAQTIASVGALPGQNLLRHDPRGMVHRWFRDAPPAPDLTYRSDDTEPLVDQYFQDAAKTVASSTDGDGSQPYNEFNTPYSPDWVVVLQWVLDRYHLVNLPPHYLITNASMLPLECVRVFQIDPNWINAMIDGGLSLANHLDRNDDRLRTAIKGAINWYLTTPIAHLNYVPPVPSYGFFVHSELITKFPDLVVDTQPAVGASDPPMVLRQVRLDDNLLLCLLHETPAAPHCTSILLRPPPHQQYFTAAESVDPSAAKLTVAYKKVYTQAGQVPDASHPISVDITRDTLNPRRGLFIWGTTPTGNDVHMLNVEHFAQDLFRTLKDSYTSQGHPEWFTEPCPTAALMGIQLNAPCWELDLHLLGYNAAMISPPQSSYPKERARQLPLPPSKPVRPPAMPTWTPRDAPCTPHPDLDHRQRPAPLRLTDPPPHVRLPQRQRVSNNLAESPTNHPLLFRYRIYPVGRDPDHGIPVRPSHQTQDLVFSILYDTGPQPLHMTGVDITIPLASSKKSASQAHSSPPLMDHYHGSGPAMLANVRWVPIPLVDGDQMDHHRLVIRLVPRSDTKVVVIPARSVGEMSFLLRSVVVRPVERRTVVHVTVREKYRGKDERRVEIKRRVEVELVPEG